MIESMKLNDGTALPMIGFGVGTALSREAAEDVDRNLVENIKTAIRTGYRHLDGAQSYLNEVELGLAIKESGVPREQLYITTKVNTVKLKNRVPDIPASFAASLKKLQLGYVDQYLIHSPFWAETDRELQQAWKDMEAIQQSGRARSIGVSNYLEQHLQATLQTATVLPAINQIEFHPYLQHGSLVAFCRAHSIAVSAYSPQTQVFKARPGPVDARSAELAAKYGVSESVLALRWVLDQGIAAITTSSKQERLADYLQAFTFQLTPEEVLEIKRLGEKKHFRGFWLDEMGSEDRA